MKRSCGRDGEEGRKDDARAGAGRGRGTGAAQRSLESREVPPEDRPQTPLANETSGHGYPRRDTLSPVSLPPRTSVARARTLRTMRLRCRWLLTLRRVHGGLGLLLLGLLLLWWHGVFVLRSLNCSCGLPLDRFAHPRTPFPFGGGGRATRATFPSTNPLLGRIFPRDEGRNRVQTPLCTEIGPERLPKIQPPPKAPPARAVAV